MATPVLILKFIIIWLDQHIGLLDSNKILKTSMSEQADPENPFPVSPNDDDDTDYFIRFRDNMEESFD
ncbi:unnamed protein product [Rotaria sordida]|uniref:Uncharacterized protein n=1 Tax=Rotaria sordida TaxID=392033 RepID=A0A814VDI8_9BILA|nr:unnamed protein product [Rotaria sordida]